MRKIMALASAPFLFVAAYVFAAGCGSSASSCESVCAKAKHCAGAVSDCAASCDAWQQIADRAGCSAELTEFYDCLSEQSDVCHAASPSGLCGYESGQPGRAFEACVEPYCAQHQAQCYAAYGL
jgi:hypothetical protein